VLSKGFPSASRGRRTESSLSKKRWKEAALAKNDRSSGCRACVEGKRMSFDSFSEEAGEIDGGAKGTT